MRYVTLAILALIPVLTLAHADEQTKREIIEFRIKKGTGEGPWNTREKPVEVKVKKHTLRIINDDDTEHLLHTGGVPCPHGPIGMNMKKGDHYDCVIDHVADPDKDECYDHNFGSKSRFYIRATN